MFSPSLTSPACCSLSVNVHNTCTFQTHTWAFLKSQLLLFSRRISMQTACCILTSVQHSGSPEDQGNRGGKGHILLPKTCFAKSSASSPWRETATSATVSVFCLVPWYMCVRLYHSSSIRGVGKHSIVMRSEQQQPTSPQDHLPSRRQQEGVGRGISLRWQTALNNLLFQVCCLSKPINWGCTSFSFPRP